MSCNGKAARVGAHHHHNRHGLRVEVEAEENRDRQEKLTYIAYKLAGSVLKDAISRTLGVARSKVVTSKPTEETRIATKMPDNGDWKLVCVHPASVPLLPRETCCLCFLNIGIVRF